MLEHYDMLPPWIEKQAKSGWCYLRLLQPNTLYQIMV